MAKPGGLLKLDAICAKLKTREPDDRGEDTEDTNEELDTPSVETNNNNKTEAVNREWTQTEAPDHVDMPILAPPSQGRKSRRKNQTPRNIAQFREIQDDFSKEELEEYEINNKDIDFNAIANEDEEEKFSDSDSEEGKKNNGYSLERTEDLSYASSIASQKCNLSDDELEPMDDEEDDSEFEQNSGTEGHSKLNGFSVDDTGALDLTVGRETSDDESLNYSRKQTPNGSISEPFHESKPIEVEPAGDAGISQQVANSVNFVAQDKSLSSNVSNTTTADEKPKAAAEPSVTDAADMKDYAESTMNELLKVYGLSDEAESIIKDVPLQNFASSTILGRHTPRVPLSKVHARMQPKFLSIPRPPVISPTVIAPKPANHNNPVTTAAPPVAGEGIYAKFIDSMSKLASLPQGTMIGSPPVLIPDGVNHLPHRPMPTVSAALAMGARPPTSGAPSGGNNNITPAGSVHMQTLSGKLAANAATKFATSAAYIKACFNPDLAPKLAAASGSKHLLPDYAKYVKRFSSYEECGGSHCRDMGYREHFHCMDCNFRVFIKKEEMIRHFKWHKKRDESLQHGFMRYSPMDDCSSKFGPCTHNGRQTHYHCLQGGCNKVYISTSDVQMHANYHRKDSAIIQEGFQRFRATEDCGTPTCSFYGQRTTHFHCRRKGCSFTFKNKADMEKHKTYHQKDEILGKDGFKKFMKYEHCTFPNCRYSKVSNHIHCIRPGCDYVLHSTGQLYSHKRKHERRDFEHAYRRFKQEQKNKHMAAMAMAKSSSSAPQGAQPTALSPAVMAVMKKEAEYIDMEDLKNLSNSDEDSMSDSPIQTPNNSGSLLSTPNSGTPGSSPALAMMPNSGERSKSVPSSTLAKLASKLSGETLGDSLTLPIPSYAIKKEAGESETDSVKGTAVGAMSPQVGKMPPGEVFIPTGNLPAVMEKREKDESWKKYLTRYTANDPCHSRCQFLYKDHYHCNLVECGMLFRSKDGVREHARYHEQQDRITSLSYSTYEEDKPCGTENCPHSGKEKHYHCLWAGCNQAIADSDPTFGRLEHHKIHEYARASAGKQQRVSLMRTPESGKRKRGRPPKYPKTEIPVVPKVELTEEELKEGSSSGRIFNGFKKFLNGEACPDDKCLYFLREHFHCVQPRCHHATDRSDILNLHAKDFHSYINILQGFEFFDRNVNCRRPHCHNNRANRHFHCVRSKCDYSFVRYSTMGQHDKKHRQAEMAKMSPLNVAIGSPGISPHTVMMSPLNVPVATPTSIATASPQNEILIAPKDPTGRSVVKAKGTYFPISTIPPSSSTVVSTVVPPGVLQAVQGAPIMGRSPSTVSQAVTISQTQSVVVTTSAPPVPSPSIASAKSGLLPLTMLLQQKAANILPQLNWLSMKMKMHYAMDQNCGRPFCKLKKKDHYHCFDCNQAFSDPLRLKAHVTKHGIKLDQSENVQGHSASGGGSVATNNGSPAGTPSSTGTVEDEFPDDEEHEDSDDEFSNNEAPVDRNENSEHNMKDGDVSSSLNLDGGSFSNLFKHQHDQDEEDNEASMEALDFSQGNMDQHSGMEDPAQATQQSLEEAGVVSPGSQGSESQLGSDVVNNGGESFSKWSGRKRIATKHEDFVDSDTVVVKQRRLSASPRTSKDESVPDGYEKYKYCDDCGHERCAYRNNLTHFHCVRKDCGYAFSDRTRIIQHTLRHERMDNIMGEEFKQYRSNTDCERTDCEHAKKASHFHCLKCLFICTDTNKVLAHRKHHNKMDNIAAQGFEKFTGTADCGVETCHYLKKQTHYHCTYIGCKYAVLGPSQMATHRMKHVTGNIGGNPSVVMSPS